MADEQGQGPSTDQENDDQSTDVDETTDDQDQDGSDEEKSDDGQQTVSKAEFQKLFARMQAADRAKTAAENKLKEKEQAELSELDRTKAQLEEANKAAEDAKAALKKMVIENAFHRENKFSWHDVGDAVAALDLSSVEVAEDGTVTGMAAAIKQVAKNKPHYVKSKQESDEGEGTEPAANGANNGKRKGDKITDLNQKALLNRFPALGK